MTYFLFTMHDIAAVVWIEITRVAKNFQESTNAFLSLFLRLLLHVNILVGLVEMCEHSIDQLEKFKGCFIVELHHAQVAHERRSVQAVHDDLDLGSVEIGRFVEHFLLVTLRTSIQIASVYRLKSG